jgi:hypothetical protein
MASIGRLYAREGKMTPINEWKKSRRAFAKKRSRSFT